VNGGDIVGVVLETLILLGISAGLLCLIVAVAVRVADGDWTSTTAVVVHEGDEVRLRWMSDDGTLHTRQIDAHEHEELRSTDAAAIYYSRRSPGRIRFTRRHEAERVFFVLAAVIGGVGVFCILASVVHAVVLS
jgi:hypothetical protein